MTRSMLDDERSALSSQFGLDAAVYGVKDREVRLFDRCYGVVDRETGFPFQPVGAVLGPLHVVIVLGLGDADLEGGHVGSNLRFHGIPVPRSVGSGGLDFLIDFLDGRLCSGTRCLLASLE